MTSGIDLSNIVRDYYPLVASTARPLCKDPRDFADTTQMGYEAICLAAERYDPTRSNASFKTYAYWWIKGNILSHYRKQHHHNVPEAPDARRDGSGDTHTEAARDAESEERHSCRECALDCEAVRAAVRNLDSPQERVAISQIYWHDGNCASVGRMLGLSRERVSQIVDSAMTKLRIALIDWDL